MYLIYMYTIIFIHIVAPNQSVLYLKSILHIEFILVITPESMTKVVILRLFAQQTLEKSYLETSHTL